MEFSVKIFPVIFSVERTQKLLHWFTISRLPRDTRSYCSIHFWKHFWILQIGITNKRTPLMCRHPKCKLSGAWAGHCSVTEVKMFLVAIILLSSPVPLFSRPFPICQLSLLTPGAFFANVFAVGAFSPKGALKRESVAAGTFASKKFKCSERVCPWKPNGQCRRKLTVLLRVAQGERYILFRRFSTKD